MKPVLRLLYFALICREALLLPFPVSTFDRVENIFVLTYKSVFLMPLVKMLRPFVNLLSLIVSPVPLLFQRDVSNGV